MSKLIFVDLPIAATLLICGLAMLKGDAPERQGATIMFVAWVSSNVVVREVTNPANLLFAIDVVVLISLSALAWTTRRAWAVVASVTQALEMVIHLARDMGAEIEVHAYYAAQAVSGYVQLLALLAGTIVAWRERAALASFGIIAQPDASSPASAPSMSSSVLSTPKIATKDPNRGPWF